MFAKRVEESNPKELMKRLLQSQVTYLSSSQAIT